MTTLVSIAVTGELSHDPRIQAVELNRVTAAWLTFLEAIKELPLETSIAIGLPPVQPRRRRGRPRLAPVPDSAA